MTSPTRTPPRRPPVYALALVAATLGAGAALGIASCVVSDPLAGQGGSGDPYWSPETCNDGMPHPGCACQATTEGLRAQCGVVESDVAGQVTCGYGETECVNGTWTECAVTGNVTLHPGMGTQTQGPPQTCDNPCDPYCQTWHDDPYGETNPDGGIVERDGGITLPLGDAGSEGDPDFCHGGAKGTCPHPLCEVGAKMTNGCDPPAATPLPEADVVMFTETFANNNLGWTLGTGWAIASAHTSSGQTYGNADPGTDTTTTSDNGVAGVVIGGNAQKSVHDYYWLTSPAINLSAATTQINLKFNRWLNSDYDPYMVNQIAVSTNNGTTWTAIWTSGTTGITDSSWQAMTYDITAYKSATFRVRFGYKIGTTNGLRTVSSWNIDDLQIIRKGAVLPPAPSCVTAICAQRPACCSASWTVDCVNMVHTVCNADCKNYGGQCFTCYHDAYDHDFDGYSYEQGDCADCDPNVNPGAYDYPGNAIDENCDGVADNEPANCDSGLALASSSAWDFAKAIDLCRVQVDPNATGVNRTWGVTAASLVQADGTSASDSLSHGIKPTFGTGGITRLKGANMAVFSSGTARVTGDPGYVNPNGQSSSYNQGLSCAFPAGIPKNAVGCPGPGNNTTANDSSGLKMTIRVPTNAKSFAYSFDFFSSEYPEWVCTAYNDTFVALLTSTNTNGNISFDANGNPVSVNVGFFGIPNCSPACSYCTAAVLAGTGFDGSCSHTGVCGSGSQSCGGSTGWLYTTAPVTPGENMTILFSVWDTGDHVWDSTVLLDNWTWSVNDAAVFTGYQPPPPPQPKYTDGWFVRDYDTTGVCPSGTQVVWGLWSWDAITPSDSRLEFYIRTATTTAGLGAASELPIEFTNPPGPVSKVGQAAIAQSAVAPDTHNGMAIVNTLFVNHSLPRNNPVARVRVHLVPSTDKLSAPTLSAWNLTFDCLPAE